MLLTAMACKSTELTKAEAADAQIEQQLKQTPYTKAHGVYHVVSTPSWGYEVNEGDTVLLWYVAQVSGSGLVFDTNVESVATEAGLQRSTSQPLRVVAGQTELIPGLRNGLLLCRLGQTANIYCNPSQGFGGEWRGMVPPWSTLVYTVQIVGLNGPGIVAERQQWASIDLQGLNADTSGMYLSIAGTATAELLPQPTDTVLGWYRCTLPNGTPLHETAETEQLPMQQLPAALALCLRQMRPGQTATLVAPSPLLYGKSGAQHPPVAPYQPLRFELRLDGIKNR